MAQKRQQDEKSRREAKEKAREERLTKWIPKTHTGKLVLAQEITSIEEIFRKDLPLLEHEIVDYLLPELQEEVLNVKTVQRTTDAGRKMSFLVTVVVGNKNGYVGVATGKGRNVRPAIERAVKNAKLNIKYIRSGCGSWECGCKTQHSVPFKVEGKLGSVRVQIMPAPKGTGIVAGGKAKKVIELAGVKDAWTRSSGDTRTTFNFAFATVKALENTRKMKLGDQKLAGGEVA